MSLSELVDILKMAPMLKTCTQGLLFHDIEFPIFPQQPPVVHTNLEDLNLDFDHYHNLSEVTLIMQKVVFPQLKIFTCISPSADLPAEAFINFLDRSSCSLQEVTLHTLMTVEGLTAEGLIDIAKAAPSIIDLTLSSTTELLLFFRTPSFQPQQREIPPSDKLLLPLLRRLTRDSELSFPWNLLPELFAPFSDAEGTGLDHSRRSKFAACFPMSLPKGVSKRTFPTSTGISSNSFYPPERRFEALIQA